jgi:hypothetical protein
MLVHLILAAGVARGNVAPGRFSAPAYHPVTPAGPTRSPVPVTPLSGPRTEGPSVACTVRRGGWPGVCRIPDQDRIRVSGL